MNVEQARLETFRLWPMDSPVDSSRIAKCGFFATGNGLEVQCHWCAIKISEWANADQVMGKHRRLSPHCPFLENPSSSGNVPINGQLQPAPAEAIGSTDLMNEQNRLATFRNWPVTFITPQSLAKAGFYYFNQLDHVRCAWCQGVIAKWEVGDNPFTEHFRFFPNCLWAQLGPNVEVSSEESIQSLGIQQIRAPKKERYSSLDARLRSFANWPMSSIQSPETLATAGFYYQNSDDQVRCFQCNGGLRSWQREDDAWFEHARWFPKCEFVQLVKGHQYIAQVQQQSRPTLEEAMAGEPVQKALQMGLNEGRIRAVTKYHLEHFGGPFKCAEALIDAVLDYQREEEQRQRQDDDIYDDDDHTQSSSVIVREVSRILDTIFKHSHSVTPSSASIAETASTSTSGVLSNGARVSEPSSASMSQFGDDFVVVQIPRRSNMDAFADDDEGGMRNIQRYLRQQSDSSIEQPNRYSPISEQTTESTGIQTATPSISPSPSTSFVPESSRLFNSDSVSTPVLMAPETTTPTTKSSPQTESEKSLSLEEENRQLKDARLCKVCMDGDVAVVYLPCGHLVTCVQCAPSVTACPLCRTAIKAFVRTFLS